MHSRTYTHPHTHTHTHTHSHTHMHKHKHTSLKDDRGGHIKDIMLTLDIRMTRIVPNMSYHAVLRKSG